MPWYTVVTYHRDYTGAPWAIHRQQPPQPTNMFGYADSVFHAEMLSAQSAPFAEYAWGQVPEEAWINLYEWRPGVGWVVEQTTGDVRPGTRALALSPNQVSMADGPTQAPVEAPPGETPVVPSPPAQETSGGSVVGAVLATLVIGLSGYMLWRMSKKETP